MRDPTRRVIERFQELMADKAKHEDVAQVNDDTNKDIEAMIAEIRPALLNASEAARELSPSRAMCLSWLLDNMHLLDANKLYVLKGVMSVLLETENQPT
ncbi:MAG TPA: hypothetical protein VEN78_28205 [Bradyrhizobium sp.]|nr:hypothetical protein [Bradyrhizobium sp.]